MCRWQCSGTQGIDAQGGKGTQDCCAQLAAREATTRRGGGRPHGAAAISDGSRGLLGWQQRHKVWSVAMVAAAWRSAVAALVVATVALRQLSVIAARGGGGSGGRCGDDT